MRHLIIVLSLMLSMAAMGQSVERITMTLSGEGGSAVGVLSSLSVTATNADETLKASPAQADGVNLPYAVGTALNAADIENVSITTSNGKISVNAEGNYTCDIYDASGRQVAMQKAKSTMSIELESGLYVVAITREGKVVCARKVIVK